MKSKQLILGSVVFVFAFGSAIASTFALQDIWVNARLNGPTGPIECVQLDEECDDSGGEACTVQVSTLQGQQSTSSTYDDSECTNQLKNTTTELIFAQPSEGENIYEIF